MAVIVPAAGRLLGNPYYYKYQVAYDAIHDWVGNKKTITKGRKAMVVVSIRID